jgi:hypothetical protein
VLHEALTPVSVETDRIETGAKDTSSKMLVGEPIVPPPPIGNNLPVARLLTSFKELYKFSMVSVMY